MASFGERTLVVNARICGTLRVLGLSSLPALYPRLGLLIGCTLTEVHESVHGLGGPLKDLEFVGLSGELRVQEHGPAVGILQWIGQNHRCRSAPFAPEDQLQLGCDLDPWRIERIERNRNGAAPIFWLQLWPVILMAGQRVHATAHPIRMEVPRDRWLEFLDGVGYGSFDVLEVRIPSERKEPFTRSLGHLRDARRQLNEGHFDDAVGCCRKAIEAMIGDAQLPNRAEDLAQALSGRLPTRRAEAYAAILSKLKHLAALGQHDLGASEPFTRAEARFILRATEDLCVLLGEVAAGEQVRT